MTWQVSSTDQFIPGGGRGIILTGTEMQALLQKGKPKVARLQSVISLYLQSTFAAG